MALEWPDFSKATITDAAPIQILYDIVAERCAAAGAYDGYGVEGDSLDWTYAAEPVLERLTRLRNTLRDLASRFIRLEVESYKWEAWSRFPIAYNGTDLMKGEHSLAILPVVGTPEANAVELERYRTFLSNCTWWLRQFRHVNVAAKSYFTRSSEASGTYNWFQYPDGEINEYGDIPEDVMAAPTHEDISRRGWNAVRNLIDCTHREHMHYEDWHSRDEGWHYDYEHYLSRQVTATAYSGLVVRNFSGLAGELLLVPCYARASPRSSQSFPYQSIETDFIDTLMPDSGFDDDGGRMAETVTYTQARFDKHDAEWLETYRSEFHGRQWYEQESEYVIAIRHEGTDVTTTTKWTLDGSRSLSETTSDEWTSWYNYTIWEISEHRIDDFDGYGEWSLGVPVSSGVIPPHDRVVAIPEKDNIPLPDVWDLEGLRLWRKTLHPRDRSDTVSYRAVLRVVPILDFNPSYQYQDT